MGVYQSSLEQYRLDKVAFERDSKKKFNDAVAEEVGRLMDTNVVIVTESGLREAGSGELGWEGKVAAAARGDKRKSPFYGHTQEIIFYDATKAGDYGCMPRWSELEKRFETVDSTLPVSMIMCILLFSSVSLPTSGWLICSSSLQFNITRFEYACRRTVRWWRPG